MGKRKNTSKTGGKARSTGAKKQRIVFYIAALALIVLLLGAVKLGWIPDPGFFPTENAASLFETDAQPSATAAAQSTQTGASAPTDLSGSMQVHFIDVGQADCILICTDEKTMLVDAGNNDDADTILSYLGEQGVTRLDYVIGTHPHEDHIGSLDKVIAALDIGEVFLPDKMATTKTFEDVLTAIDEKGLTFTVPKVGDTYSLGEGSFTILAPGERDYGDEMNNWSIGIKVEFGATSFVMCGDAELLAESDIVATGLDLKATVFKAGHHGSATSNSNAMLDAVQPEFMVISCGKDNKYGHPHQETMDKLKERNIAFFRTDEQGTVVAETNGRSILWNRQPSDSYKTGEGDGE